MNYYPNYPTHRLYFGKVVTAYTNSLVPTVADPVGPIFSELGHFEQSKSNLDLTKFSYGGWIINMKFLCWSALNFAWIHNKQILTCMDIFKKLALLKRVLEKWNSWARTHRVIFHIYLSKWITHLGIFQYSLITETQTIK